MAKESKTLKSQNWKYIIPYIGLNLVAFYVVMVGVDNVKIAGANGWNLAETALKSTVWTTGLGLLAVVLNGLVSSHIKAVLIFWRPRYPLPGCRAFSRYVHTDPRIAPGVLQNRFGRFPSDPASQNSLWYRIYRRHEEHPSVKDAHSGYLLTRDLTALSAIFLMILGAAALYLMENAKHALYYMIVLAALYGLTSQAARTYGKRFVTSVLAIESSS
jgi:hypothetical protein